MNELESLGWRNFFAVQVDPAEALEPARVLAVHRGRIDVAGTGFETGVPLSGHVAGMQIVVGDWLLLDSGRTRVVRRLERFAAFRRGAAGTSHTIQYIAANVDTVFVVTSADRDFNVARLERYLAVAHDAGTFPVVVITKADLVESADGFVSRAVALASGLLAEAVDARSVEDVQRLRPWCGPGQTVALLGSSGVGKSTLVNTLTDADQQTRPVRDDDQRGRHTTTGRSMHRLPQGGWLIDTPGLRELQLVDVGDALDNVFSDIAELARCCRFSDCEHGAEPGCAVQEAIQTGRLDGTRLKRFRKLRSEDRRNTETIAERRARDRALGQLYKSIQSDKRHLKENSD